MKRIVSISLTDAVVMVAGLLTGLLVASCCQSDDSAEKAPAKTHRVKALAADGITVVGEWSEVHAEWLVGRIVCSMKYSDGRVVHVAAPIIIVEEIEVPVEATTSKVLENRDEEA